MYARRRREVTEPIDLQQEAALNELRSEAQARDVALELTAAGLMTVPVRDGHALTTGEFGQLPEEVREGYQRAVAELEPKMQAFLIRVRSLQREARDRLRSLEREVGLFSIGHLIDELKDRHAGSAKLGEWLTSVAEDVTDNIAHFQGAGSDGDRESQEPLLAASGVGADQTLGRYEVNVFVAHDEDGGAPVVVETNPTYPNLFGRIEHRGMLGGGIATDHRMLREGAVHHANGGYLMLPAAEVLAQPLVWLKLQDILGPGASGSRTPPRSTP